MLAVEWKRERRGSPVLRRERRAKSRLASVTNWYSRMNQRAMLYIVSSSLRRRAQAEVRRLVVVWVWEKKCCLLNQQVWIFNIASFEWCQTLASAAVASVSYVSSETPWPDRTREYSRKTSSHSSNDIL